MLTSDLQRAADSVQIERLLPDEVGVAALRQLTGPELLEEGGRSENHLRQQVAVTPHNVKQTHVRDDAWEERNRHEVTKYSDNAICFIWYQTDPAGLRGLNCTAIATSKLSPGSTGFLLRGESVGLELEMTNELNLLFELKDNNSVIQ